MAAVAVVAAAVAAVVAAVAVAAVVAVVAAVAVVRSWRRSPTIIWDEIKVWRIAVEGQVAGTRWLRMVVGE